MTHAQIKEIADKIVALLDGFKYKDAHSVLKLVDDKLSGYLFVLAEEITSHQAEGLDEIVKLHGKL